MNNVTMSKEPQPSVARLAVTSLAMNCLDTPLSAADWDSGEGVRASPSWIFPRHAHHFVCPGRGYTLPVMSQEMVLT